VVGRGQHQRVSARSEDGSMPVSRKWRSKTEALGQSFSLSSAGTRCSMMYSRAESKCEQKSVSKR